MSRFQRYLAEEIAVDHADGIIPGREALRRLGLLGFSVAAAVPFYGPLPEGADFSRSKAAVLGIHAELDPPVTSTRQAAAAARAYRRVLDWFGRYLA